MGEVRVQAGTIDGNAHLRATGDLFQIIYNGCVWSRFPETDGSYRTSQTTGEWAPAWLRDALDAWENSHRLDGLKLHNNGNY